MSAIRQAIADLTHTGELNADLAALVATEILEGAASLAQIGSFLTALRIRGEKPEHVLAFARVMRGHAAPLDLPDRESLVDTCGTGGDASGTFNISTAAAIIAAGAGARIAKHGNRAISGKCGSADVLTALGVNIELKPEYAARCLGEAGCVFLFAPTYHPAMRHAAPARREIGIRTIFNMLGPLSNPAGAARQVIGVYDSKLTDVFAHALKELGSRRAMVVHGSDGLDEITVTGETTATELKDGVIRKLAITPESAGVSRAKPDELLGGDAEVNAAIIRAILKGEKGAHRDIAALNAAAALVVADRAPDLKTGVAQACESLDSGAAAKVLERLVAASQAK